LVAYTQQLFCLLPLLRILKSKIRRRQQPAIDDHETSVNRRTVKRETADLHRVA